MKIMAVDDDVVSLDLLNECLTQGGYEHLSLLSSSGDVVQRLINTAIPYDCILLDVEMPGKNGIELCGEIRALPRYRNTPILMITKHRNHAAVQQAFANGATDYITKPFEFFEVLTRIRVAERLVQERQAAIDSYVSAQSSSRKEPALRSVTAEPHQDILSAAQNPSIPGDEIMSLSVFQNYLEQVTQSSDCSVDLIAIKIRRIDSIFANTTPSEFIDLLRAVADAVVMELGSESTFMTHVGKGVFLCATPGPSTSSPDELERAVSLRLQEMKLPRVCRNELHPELLVGEPLTLKTGSKLNFRRASKASMARMESRDAAADGLTFASLTN